MVHKLLQKPSSNYYTILEGLGVSRSLVDYYTDLLAYLANKGDYEKYTYMSFIILQHLALRAVCSVYSYKFAEFCSSGVIRDPNIEYYKGLLLRIVRIKGLEKVIPEVGSNLAYAVQTPSSLSDVIGLTGGIVKTIDGVVFYGEPIYGGSRHVGRVLVEASRFNSQLRFCFNIKCTNKLKSILEEMGYSVEVTGPHLREEDFWSELVKALSKKPTLICDLGGLRLEPVMYILTRDPVELEELLKIAIGVV